MKTILFLIISLLAAESGLAQDDIPGAGVDNTTALVAEVGVMSLLGEPLRPRQADQQTLEKLSAAQAYYDADPDTADNIIWLGRRLAYAGDYRAAIALFTRGIDLFPDDARMYRHRGHRFISVREFGHAIEDLERAASLIAGHQDQVEPDGLPNAMNIPVSSLHTNIWYHLGLAYYLEQDWPNAWRAFEAGYLAGNNDDNRVSTTHWLYMILRRMGREKEATAVLADISPDMDIIENHVYHRLCLFYAGLIPAEEVSGGDGDNPTRSAAAYGLANWVYYNDDPEEGLRLMRAQLNTDSWAAFGYIAAESEVAASQD